MVSDEQLIKDLQEFADEIGETPTTRKMDEHGPWSDSTYNNHFDSWTNAMEKAGLEPKNECNRGSGVNNDKLIEDLKEFADELGEDPSRKQMNELGPWSDSIYHKHFDSWTNAMEKAGLEPKTGGRKRCAGKGVLIEDLKDFADELGETPTAEQMNSLGPWSSWTYSKYFDSWRNAIEKADMRPSTECRMGKNICTQCGNNYSSLSSHWGHPNTPCEYRSLTDKQIEIATGLVMGDGTINRVSKKPSLSVVMISQNYLEYISNQFGSFGTDVSLHQTAEESATSGGNRFSKNPKEENYSDLYRWRTMTHPDLQQFADWYKTGKKVFPKNIDLTPTVLKHWYCGDGHKYNNDVSSHISIGISNEIDNIDKIYSYFHFSGLPEPQNHTISEREDGSKNVQITWTVKDSHALWEYMGEPLPDFEYKWPDGF